MSDVMETMLEAAVHRLRSQKPVEAGLGFLACVTRVM